MNPIGDEAYSELMRTNMTHHDCGVVALMAVTDLPRSKADQLCRQHGFTDTGGTPREALPAAVRDLGREVEDVAFYRGDTVATFAVAHEYGGYLLYVDKHVMPLVDGDLYNARGHWNAPLEAVVLVHPS